ncbi:MAG: hypothetical protein JWN46_1281 [Acidimicrobiales bacterium]|nr:hypothetical protein [Acidimicrobiales bacterium]
MGSVGGGSEVMAWPLEVAIGHLEPFDGEHVLRGWLMGPSAPARTRSGTIVHCFAGGGVSVSSFDLHVEGVADLSLAEHLARQGRYVVALDHLGVGASPPVPDLYMVDADVAVEAQLRAFAAVHDGLRRGDLVAGLDALEPATTIGLGHSMGGMIVDLLQARAGVFDGLIVLSHSGAGLPDVLCDAELALAGTALGAARREILALARARFEPGSTVPARAPAHGRFFGADVPAEVIAAMSAHQAQLLPTCGLAAIIPGVIDGVMASIDVPVLLGSGEPGLVAGPHAVVASYRASADVSLFVLPGAGHCVNQAGNRQELWRRMDRWIGSLEPQDGAHIVTARFL